MAKLEVRLNVEYETSYLVYKNLLQSPRHTFFKVRFLSRLTNALYKYFEIIIFVYHSRRKKGALDNHERSMTSTDPDP